MPEMVETEKNSVTKRRPPAPLFHVLYCFAFPGGICYNDPVREVISMQAYDRISRYKGALMGIMILIVVYGHLLYYHSGCQLYQFLGPEEWYTVGSVDIFLFLSGFGISFSLKKNGDPLQFMQRRMSRILPSYLPFIVVYCAFMLWSRQIDVFQALGNLTTFGWWTRMGGQFNWYIPIQIAAYVISPLLYQIIDRYGKRALWVFPVLFLADVACVNTSLMMGVSRFPVYFLGMYLGYEAAAGKQPTRRHLVISWVLMVVSMVAYYFLCVRWPDGLAAYGFWWHPFLLSTPGCLYMTTWILQKMDAWKPTAKVNRGLEFLGGKSFEIYLCHILIYEIGLYFGVGGWKKWILLALCGLTAGTIYSYLVEALVRWRKKL